MVKKRNPQKKQWNKLQSNFSDWLYLSCSVSAVLISFFRVPKFARQYSRAFKCWSLFWNQNHFGNVKSLLSWSFIFGTHKIYIKKRHLIYFSWPSLLSARPSQTITRRIKIKAVFINWVLTSCQVLCCVFHLVSS